MRCPTKSGSAETYKKSTQRSACGLLPVEMSNRNDLASDSEYICTHFIIFIQFICQMFDMFVMCVLLRPMYDILPPKLNN